MSEERVLQNMMNLARHSNLIPEGKEELFKIFLRVVYQSVRIDAIVEKTRVLHLTKKGENRDGTN